MPLPVLASATAPPRESSEPRWLVGPLELPSTTDALVELRGASTVSSRIADTAETGSGLRGGAGAGTISGGVAGAGAAGGAIAASGADLAGDGRGAGGVGRDGAGAAGGPALARA